MREDEGLRATSNFAPYTRAREHHNGARRYATPSSRLNGVGIWRVICYKCLIGTAGHQGYLSRLDVDSGHI